MWLATVANRDWPSRPGLTAAEQRAELLAHLDTAVARRLNAVVFQVRPTADALWPSPYEPWSQYLTGVQGTGPRLGPARHRRARRPTRAVWSCTPGSTRTASPTTPTRPGWSPTHPARVHPDWVVPYGGKLYYNPGMPEVRAFVQDAMLDAVRRYAIDAVHFDDYFYPYPVAGQVFDDDAAYDRVRRAASRTGPPGGATTSTGWCARWPPGSRRSGRHAASASAPSACGATPRPTRSAPTPRPACRRTTICTPTPASGSRGLDRLHRARSSTGTSASPPPTTPSSALVGRGRRGARASSSTSVRPSTRRATPPSPRPGRTRPSCPGTSPSPADYPEVRGHVFFSAKEVVADRIGAMARVVADHYRAAGDARRAEPVAQGRCPRGGGRRSRGRGTSAPRARPRSGRGTGGCPSGPVPR